MLTIMENTNFKEIEMGVALKYIEAFISHIITYVGEAIEPTPSNYKDLNRIMDNIIKRVLKTTPREVLYMETGLIDPKTTIKKNRINLEHRIKKSSKV